MKIYKKVIGWITLVVTLLAIPFMFTGYFREDFYSFIYIVLIISNTIFVIKSK